MTKIEWTDVTWNPVRGCTKIAPGCAHCYAETFAERFRGVPGHAYEQGFDLRLVPEKLAEPLKWKTPRRVFVNSMSDLFHEDVPDTFIAAVFGVMAATPKHTYQILTKRSKRMRAWFRWLREWETDDPSAAIQLKLLAACVLEGMEGPGLGGRILDASWPLRNVWLGVSCEDQRRADERIPDLLATPAAVRFVSAEPLLGPIDFRQIGTYRGEHLSAFDEIVGHVERPPLSWVIVGGESGPGARPCRVEWVRDIVRQCKAATVPVFCKQLGSVWAREHGGDRKGGAPEFWPAGDWPREFPNG